MAPTPQYATFSIVLILCLHLCSPSGMVWGDESHDSMTVSTSSMQTDVCSETTVPPNSWKVVHRAGPSVPDSAVARMGIDDEIHRRESLRAAYLHNQIRAILVEGIAATGRNSSTSADPLRTSLQHRHVTLPARSGLLYSGSFIYLVTLTIGTPAKPQTVVLDTDSSMLWVQCAPCTACHQQRDPMFDRTQSEMYQPVPCDDPACTNLPRLRRGCVNNTCTYNIAYADKSYSRGILAKDTLALSRSGDQFRQFAFGCGLENRITSFIGASGIMGLSRKFYSLETQRSSAYGNVFSYCLPSTYTVVGYLTLGGSDAPNPSYTPMLQRVSHPGLYFVYLTGISVDDRRLAISERVFQRYGTLIDSGTSISLIDPEVYAELRRVFRNDMRRHGHQELPGVIDTMDTCYDVGWPGFVYPHITLHFSGASIPLSFAQVFDQPNPINGTKYCLGFSSSAPDGLRVLGSSQQRGMEIIYDIGGNKIGFYHGPSCL